MHDLYCYTPLQELLEEQQWYQAANGPTRFRFQLTAAWFHWYLMKFFGSANIRYRVSDVVAVLTDSVNPSDYLKKLRQRDPTLSEAFKGGGQFVPLLVVTSDNFLTMIQPAKTAKPLTTAKAERKRSRTR